MPVVESFFLVLREMPVFSLTTKRSPYRLRKVPDGDLKKLDGRLYRRFRFSLAAQLREYGPTGDRALILAPQSLTMSLVLLPRCRPELSRFRFLILQWCPRRAHQTRYGTGWSFTASSVVDNNEYPSRARPNALAGDRSRPAGS